MVFQQQLRWNTTTISSDWINNDVHEIIVGVVVVVVIFLFFFHIYRAALEDASNGRLSLFGRCLFGGRR